MGQGTFSPISRREGSEVGEGGREDAGVLFIQYGLVAISFSPGLGHGFGWRIALATLDCLKVSRSRGLSGLAMSIRSHFWDGIYKGVGSLIFMLTGIGFVCRCIISM